MNNYYILVDTNPEYADRNKKVGDFIHYHKYQEPCNERCFRVQQVLDSKETTVE